MSVLNTQDWSFIERQDALFPEKDITAKFNFYAALVPSHRLAQSFQDLHSVLRAGWQRIGVPIDDVQTVAAHTRRMMQLCGSDDHAAAIAEVHDLPEVIAGDFTPADTISSEDKFRLEYLAAQVIFEAFPERMAHWLEYEECKTKAALLVKDIDRVEMLEKAAEYERKYPQLRSRLEEFWLYAVPRIVTAPGKAALAQIKRL